MKVRNSNGVVTTSQVATQPASGDKNSWRNEAIVCPGDGLGYPKQFILLTRLFRQKDTDQLPQELRAILDATEADVFNEATGEWDCICKLTKGQAWDISDALMKLPNVKRNAMPVGAVTTTHIAPQPTPQPVPTPQPEHVDVEGYRLVQLASGETLRFKLTKDGNIDHRAKPEFVK